jgi:hypothetical protein
MAWPIWANTPGRSWLAVPMPFKILVFMSTSTGRALMMGGRWGTGLDQANE